MEVTLKLIMPDTLEALVRAQPDAVCSAIERAVMKTLSKEVRTSARIAFPGEDYNGDPLDPEEVDFENVK